MRVNSLLVAVLGVLGGYGTPVMLTTGEVNFVGPFSYMLLLGYGVLGITYKKNWHLLNYLSFLCTCVLLGKLVVCDLPSWKVGEALRYAGEPYSFLEATMRLFDFRVIIAILYFGF